MRLPGFFIVGAPKCGTTTLYTYLAAHPRLFLSPLKEPNYFCLDTPGLRVIDRADSYARLFETAGPDQACGESSTAYLYSEVAVAAILDGNPAAKIIVLVRNPLEMVVSYHSQKVYNFEENEPNFETAWRLSEQRAMGKSVGPNCRAPGYLNYKAFGRLGEQLQRLKTLVPVHQLHVIVFDDLRADPAAVHRNTLRFLSVPMEPKAEFSVVNARKMHALPALARFLMRPPPPLRELKAILKLAFPARAKALGGALHRLNRRPGVQYKVSNRLREEMIAEFRDDVDLLGRLLDRDLRHWCCQ